MDEENSGKSKLLFNFVDYYVNIIFQECGVEGGTKFVNLDETKVTLLFWGISGLDDLRSLPKNDLCEFAGALLVYNIACRSAASAYEEAIKQFEYLQNSCNPNVTVILVGVKNDLGVCREVTNLEANEFVQSKGLIYMETCAFVPEQVEDCLGHCVRMISAKSQFVLKGWSVIVKNITVEAHEETIRDTFKQFGGIRNMLFSKDRVMIQYHKNADAIQAVAALHGSDMFGEKLM